MSKTIKIRKHNLLDARRDKSIKKWKLWVAKVLKLPILHRYNFMYSVNYYAGTIHKDDVIVSASQKVTFMVLSAGNGIANIITHKAFPEQPHLSGLFHVMQKKEKNKKTKK